jgi:isocitrate/isopropylmalate dehydrogenase
MIVLKKGNKNPIAAIASIALMMGGVVETKSMMKKTRAEKMRI